MPSVVVNCPTAIVITGQDGKQITIPAGISTIKAKLAAHWYVAANGGVIVKDAPEAERVKGEALAAQMDNDTAEAEAKVAVKARGKKG